MDAAASRLSTTARIALLIDDLPPGTVTIRQILSLVGRDGLMAISALLTLVFLVPVSIPGVSTVFGAGILLISLERLRREPLQLPARLANRQLPSERIRGALRRGLKWLARLEAISRRDRYPGFISGGAGFHNLGHIIGALLLMAPFGFIPFSNTLPAMGLLLFSIGFLQRDGVCVLLGHVGNIVSALYFSLLFFGGGALIGRVTRSVIEFFS